MRILTLAALLCLSSPVSAQELIKVIDGDTITVMDKEPRIVRLLYIDAPEKKQPYGLEAKSVLTALLTCQKFKIIYRSHDRYNRYLGVVSTDTDIINLKMVEEGYAWSYKRKKGPYGEAQREAQREHKGLWADPNPEAPWDYRKRIRGRYRRITMPGREVYIRNDLDLV